jgi:hypothetical protein
MKFEHGISSLHIIDSTKESDGEPGTMLLKRLSEQSPAFTELPVYLHVPFDKSEMKAVTDRIFSEEVRKGFVPILHFEVHGCETGFSLRDDSLVAWDDFSLELARFNVATRFNLLTVFACCQGFLQIHSMNYSRACPFTGLVGCIGEPTTQELLECYDLLYRGIASQTPIDKAVQGMKAGLKSGSTVEFGLETAARMFRGVIEMIYRDNLNTDYLSEKKEAIRQKMLKEAALERILSPISSQQMERTFQESLEREVRKFHRNYFAVDQIPENAARYSFESMVTEVRRLVEARATTR